MSGNVPVNWVGVEDLRDIATDADDEGWVELKAVVLTEAADQIEALSHERDSLRADAARLLYFVRDCIGADEIGQIDIHIQAGTYAIECDREEANDEDYLKAVRDAIDSAMKEQL